MDILKALYDFFPMAVYTGQCLVFISDESKVELWEHKKRTFGSGESECPIVRVKIFRKTVNDEFIPGHYQDFQIEPLDELANQIERYIQFAVGRNIRENV